jgi:lysozyme
MTLVEQLVLHEGLRLTPYVDTVGKITIGIGRNLTDRGITEAQAYAWLDEDIAVAVRELTARFPWFAALDEIRRRVLIDMHINLGMQRLKGFRQFLGYVEAQDYRKAAEEMLASRWATQVGGRATRLAGMMRTGTV